MAMKQWVWTVGVLMLASASAVSFGQEKPKTNAQPHVVTGIPLDEGELAKMAWFIGNWRSEIKPEKGAPALTVASEMRWAENHRAITFQVWFTSEGKRDPHYYGMYAWDPGEKTLKMWQVAKDGNLSIGKATTNGKTFTQLNHMVRADGSTQEQRTEIVRDGNDAYDWKVQLMKDGQWVDALKLRYERVKSKTKAGGMR
jgi:hypothetical protein